MADDNWRPHPKFRAHSFQIAFCDDPNCGLHLVAYNEDGSPMSEVVMSTDQTLRTMMTCKDFLYDKAVKKS